MRFLRRESIQIASASSTPCDIFCSVTGRAAYHGEDPALGRVHPPGRAPQPLKMPPHRFSTDTRKNLWLGDSPLFRPVASRGQQVAREPTDKRPGGAVKDPMATRNCPVELCGSASPVTASLGFSCSLPFARCCEGALTEALER